MSSYQLSKRAERNLREILDHNEAKWDARQSRQYADLLDETIRKLAEYPLWPASRVVEGNIRRYPVGQHVIIYRATTTGVEILRLLHKRMDIKRHLPSSDL